MFQRKCDECESLENSMCPGNKKWKRPNGFVVKN